MASAPLVMVANDPAAYRSVLAQALALLRPDLCVRQLDPADVETVIVTTHPCLIICNQLMEPVRRAARASIVLAVAGEGPAVVSLPGQQWRLANPQLADVLAAIDAAVRAWGP
jgi:hypothetical protein